MRKGFFLAVFFALVFLTGCGSNRAYQYSSQDASEAIAAAQEFYGEEAYEDSLRLYLEAIRLDSKSEEAQLGVIRCQTALGNYDMALENLDILIMLNPYIEEIYDLYIQIAQETDKIYLAIHAVDMADRYGVESFMEKVPKTPVVSVESGTYQEALDVEVTAAEPDVELKYQLTSDLLKNSGNVYQYTDPLYLPSGNIELSVYAVKDEIPSIVKTVNYVIESPGEEISFADPLVESLVRYELDKLEGSVTDIDCWQIQSLDSYNLQADLPSGADSSELKIKTLEDLRWMPNLDSINLDSQDEITDYSSISMCKRLSYLRIENGNLTDVNFVSTLSDLSTFSIRDNQVGDITPLLNCKDILSIDLCGNPIIETDEVLAQLPLLRYIELDDHQLKDYGVLEEKKELVSLYISGLEKVDYAEIGKLTTLMNLGIQRDWEEEGYSNESGIADLSFVSGLTNLTDLSLNGVEDASQLVHLYGLTNLQNLYLYNGSVGENAEAMEQLVDALPNCQIRW